MEIQNGTPDSDVNLLSGRPYFKGIVNSAEWSNDFNVQLEIVCKHFWEEVVSMSEKIEDENGNKLSINCGDLSNVVTQVAQAWRRDKQEEAQKSEEA